MPAPTLEERRIRQASIFDKTQRAHDQRGRATQLVRKQISDQNHWLRVWADIGNRISLGHAQRIVEDAARESVEAIDRYVDGAGGRIAYGWSGGKDSLALQVVMDRAAIEDSVFVITDLEYPAFLAWATDRMPDGCEVIHRAEINMAWLAQRPDMLFPPDATASGRWFSAVQHAGQSDYIRRRGVSLMFLGRRSMDGNMCGRNGYTESKRGRFFSPIRDWTHEEVLGVLHHFGMELPPIYRWPRGFQVGTGPWPARQFCRDVQMGWREVWEVDPNVVQQASSYLPSAREFLKKVA